MQNTTDYNTSHPYAEILRAIADGKKIQFYSSVWSWSDVTHGTALSIIADYGYDSEPEAQFRIKPETILINGIEVPKPSYEPLNLGTIYYYPYLEGEDDNRYTWVSWDNDDCDNRLLKLGLLHLTKEAADKHAEALLSFTQQD